ncbi:glucose-6-phosphate isomerase, partial [Neisseria meningitidis]
SVWSPVGLPVMVADGGARFRELVAGVDAFVSHFFHTSPRPNIPVLMALNNVWDNNFQHADGPTAVPYSPKLRPLPGWLCQLVM